MTADMPKISRVCGPGIVTLAQAFGPADRAGRGRDEPPHRFRSLGPGEPRPALRPRRDGARRAGRRRRATPTRRAVEAARLAVERELDARACARLRARRRTRSRRASRRRRRARETGPQRPRHAREPLPVAHQRLPTGLAAARAGRRRAPATGAAHKGREDRARLGERRGIRAGSGRTAISSGCMAPASARRFRCCRSSSG